MIVKMIVLFFFKSMLRLEQMSSHDNVNVLGLVTFALDFLITLINDLYCLSHLFSFFKAISNVTHALFPKD
jgi:hypothetical protein